MNEEKKLSLTPVPHPAVVEVRFQPPSWGVNDVGSKLMIASIPPWFTAVSGRVAADSTVSEDPTPRKTSLFSALAWAVRWAYSGSSSPNSTRPVLSTPSQSGQRGISPPVPARGRDRRPIVGDTPDRRPRGAPEEFDYVVAGRPYGLMEAICVLRDHCIHLSHQNQFRQCLVACIGGDVPREHLVIQSAVTGPPP